MSVYLKPNNNATYTPGQFITLKLNIEGQSVTRSYSFSSTRDDPDWRITIKKIDGGLASNHLHDGLEEGDEVEFIGPDGMFVLDQNPEIERHIFIGAGSGITPLFSMLDHALQSTSKQITLLYGSKNEKETIFLEHLKAWQKAYSRFELKLFLSQPSLKSIFFSKKTPYHKGRITEDYIHSWLKSFDWEASQTAFYLCGPGEMNTQFKSTLLALGVPEKHINFEFFSSGVEEEASSDQGHAEAEVMLNGERIEVMVHKGGSVLDALIDAGYDPPYSCTAGTCCTCMAHMTKGQVKMQRNDALSKREVKDGFILTCQAKPVSDHLSVNYDFD